VIGQIVAALGVTLAAVVLADRLNKEQHHA